MWYKTGPFMFCIGFGIRDPLGEYLSYREWGVLLIAIGTISWLLVKLPVVVILLGVAILLTSSHM